jgi:diacylglycerol kinase family enzyme
MRRPLAIILNCAARNRRAAEQRTQLTERLASTDLQADLFCAEDGEEMATLARRVADQGYPVVVAGGGDGTVSAVASAIAGTDAALGVLPFGTINHFAKSMGIPRTLEGAVQTLADGDTIRVDVGEVNGRVFVNNSTFGMHPSIVRYRDDLRRRHGMNKWVAYAAAAAALIPRHEYADVRLVAGAREACLRTPFVFIGNNDYRLGDLELGGGAQPGPGELGVGVARPEGRLPVLRLLGAAALGRLDRARGFDLFRTGELLVESAGSSFLTALDGEVVEMTPPLFYRSRPAGLRVIAPPRAEKATRADRAAPSRERQAAVAG